MDSKEKLSYNLNMPDILTNIEQKSWILLRKKQVQPTSEEADIKNSFEQKGPYSIRQIRDFLRTGFCSSRDFVWTEGFKEWRRISLIPSFPSHPSQTIKDILSLQEQKNSSSKELKILRHSPASISLDWPELTKFIKSTQTK